MKFSEAIEYVDKNRGKAAVAVNRAEKEIFILEFYEDTDDEGGGYLIVHYEKDFGDSSGEEDSLYPDEACDQFPYIESLDFLEVHPEVVSNLYDREFGHQLEVLGLK